MRSGGNKITFDEFFSISIYIERMRGERIGKLDLISLVELWWLQRSMFI